MAAPYGHQRGQGVEIGAAFFSSRSKRGSEHRDDPDAHWFFFSRAIMPSASWGHLFGQEIVREIALTPDIQALNRGRARPRRRRQVSEIATTGGGFRPRSVASASARCPIAIRYGVCIEITIAFPRAIADVSDHPLDHG